MQNQKYNRDKHYKSYTFRIDERTHKKLYKLKTKTGLSWNLLFLEMAFQFDIKKRESLKYQPYAGKIMVKDENGKVKIIKIDN